VVVRGDYDDRLQDRSAVRLLGPSPASRSPMARNGGTFTLRRQIAALDRDQPRRVPALPPEKVLLTLAASARFRAGDCHASATCAASLETCPAVKISYSRPESFVGTSTATRQASSTSTGARKASSFTQESAIRCSTAGVRVELDRVIIAKRLAHSPPPITEVRTRRSTAGSCHEHPPCGARRGSVRIQNC